MEHELTCAKTYKMKNITYICTMYTHTHTHTRTVLHLCHSTWTSCSWVQFCAQFYCKNRKTVFYVFFPKIQALLFIYWTDCSQIWHLEKEHTARETVGYISVLLAMVQYNLPHFTSAQNVILIFLTNGSHTGRSRFVRGMFLKNIMQTDIMKIKHKITI